MKTILLFCSFLVSGFGVPVGQAAVPSADAALDAFFREHLEEGFRQRPTMATRLGDHRFDGELDDVSPAARARWDQRTRDALAALPGRVAFEELSPAGRVDYRILEHELRYALWRSENFDPYATDPRVYNGLLSGAVFGLLTQSTEPLETNVAHVISRIRAMPAVLAAARESLDNPPRVHVETAIRQNRGNLRFFETEIFALAGETRQRAELRAAAEGFLPALHEYQAFLEEDLLPRADGDWRIGREKYFRKFALETDAGISAEENYADALAEFDRVRNDLYVLARQAWSGYFPGEVLPPDDPEGRRLTIERVLQHIGQDHGEPETLVRDARANVDAIKGFITRAGILALPEPDRCRIIEMPEFQRGNAVAYMNSPPPLDPEATGHFAISPPPASWDAVRIRSFLEEYNRQMLRILAIHEAYPGHYVQMEYANRHPSLIRKVLRSGVYVEGWAVYTEQMMLDQGYGDGDLALRLTQLKFYLRAVANKILDYRMHCEAMTDEEAMDLLVRQAFQSEGEARLKVIRAKQSSVQLATYFTGRMAHYRLRQDIQRELGDAFRLDGYHEAVLAPGPVPMNMLPALVRAELGLAPDGAPAAAASAAETGLPPADAAIALKAAAARAILDAWVAQDPEPADRKLHLVLWTPRDREPSPRYRERLSAIFLDIQAYYAREMERLGFGPRTIGLDIAEDGLVRVHLVQGLNGYAAYDVGSGGDIREECLPVLREAGLDPDEETIVLFCTMANWDPEARTISQNSPYYASGTHLNGTAWQVDSPILDVALLTDDGGHVRDGQYGRISLGRYNSIFIGGAAHELGHALGLPHNLERPDEREAYGTALMGSGNRTYGEERRGEGRGSFLTLANGLRLASHPMFSGSVKGAHLRRFARPTDLDIRPVGNGNGFSFSGRVIADPPVYAVIGYMDPEGGSDYDATTTTAVPDAEGRFTLDCQALAPGKAGELRVVFLQANGVPSGFLSSTRLRYPYTTAEDGTVDLSAALAALRAARER